MRIAMVNLTGGGLSGGYRRYLAEMMPRLQRAPGVEALEVFLPRTAPVAQHVPIRRFDDARSLDTELAAVRPDVLFVPTARYIQVRGVPTVIMVHNMEPLVRPWQGNSCKESLKNWARAWEARRACRCSRRVIAVSEAVRDFLVKRWGLPPEKVAVIPHGANSQPPAEPRCPPSLASELTGGFLFTAGSLRPARGLDDLADALRRIESPLPPLVIAGSPDPGSAAWAAKMRRRFEATRQRVIWAGQLGAWEMTWCYQQASAFVMTSRVEACPITVLESLNAGAVCISTDTAPMPEFYGEAALYYKAGDGPGLASLLQKVVADPRAFAPHRFLACRRSRAFTWESTALRTLEQLEAACHADRNRQ